MIDDAVDSRPGVAATADRPIRRVGILTLPFHVNLGGIMQAAALYRWLGDNGWEPVVLNKKPAKSAFEVAVGALLKRIPGQNIANVRHSEKQRAIHYDFIARHMPNVTKLVRSHADLADAVERHRLDAVIVGSDQVWRPDYHGDGDPAAYFLDFVDPERARRIAYAASFGRDRWQDEIAPDRIAGLLRDFTAVSVREASGARICAEAFGIADAAVTIDPTLLVDRGFYDDVSQPGERPIAEDYCFEYVLDRSVFAEGLVEAALEPLPGTCSVLTAQPHGQGPGMTIPEWVSAFRSARHVVTDSFHGTVFSILFERPFVSLVNVERGADRFVQLVSDLGLEDRLLSDPSADKIAALLQQPIDYASVGARLTQARERSADFLRGALA